MTRNDVFALCRPT